MSAATAQGRRLIVEQRRPSDAVLARYEAEHKAMLPTGDVPEGCEVIEADFWRREIARHDRWRLAYTVWSVLAQKLL